MTYSYGILALRAIAKNSRFLWCSYSLNWSCGETTRSLKFTSASIIGIEYWSHDFIACLKVLTDYSGQFLASMIKAVLW